MALTKDFRETIRERAQREPRFRKALLREAIELMLSGDEKTGRAILRNYINATVSTPQSASGAWRRRPRSRQTA
jgi:ribosomal protein L13